MEIIPFVCEESFFIIISTVSALLSFKNSIIASVFISIPWTKFDDFDGSYFVVLGGGGVELVGLLSLLRGSMSDIF